MERNILKKLVVIILIIMLTATDFFWLGSGIASYAASLDNSTNNENIEFSAYFKNEKGETVESISPSIKAQDLKLYAQITVKNEGYFNGTIEILDSNFNVKNNKLSDSISSIEGNKINLNQINAGSTVEIELDIEPIISEKISSEMLAKESTVKLTGTYMENTYKGLSIEAEKNVKLDLKVDETAQAELSTEIVTNKVFSINGENKRIVQLLIKSRLTENQYPIKQTTLKVNVPQLGEEMPKEVKVLSLGTNATNGKTGTEIENWKNENGVVEITLQNEGNEISWKKDCYDELIVTFIYNEQADASIVEIETNSEISIHNSESKFTARHLVGIENKELNNIITSTIEDTSAEIYKGQLYANSKNTEKKEIPFSSKTTVEIRSTDIADSITVQEIKDVYATENSELSANTRFISTVINKQNMLDILGEDGQVQFKYGDTIYSVSKDTEADESGNITINYDVNVSELQILISKPIKAGKLEIKHNKAIIGDSNTTEQIRTIKALKLRNTVTALLGETKVVENVTEISKELKETSSQAELTINKQNLSTMTTNKEVIIGVKLRTDETKYDLYKNPTIKIQLPQSVENIEINSFDKLYADEFEIQRAVYNKVTKTIEISLVGEQLQYAESSATQLYLQINANITLNKAQPSITDKIIMEFTNENAIPNVVEKTTLPTGTVEKEVNIVSPTGLITMNNIETYNIEGITGTSEDKQLATVDKRTAGGTDVQFRIALVNNTQNRVNNVKILGKFPTDGQFTRGTETITNNFATTLSSGINAQNCTIYYSANMNATSDISNASNGWKTNLSEVTNPKSYLIEIASMEVATSFEATYSVRLPATLDYDLTSYTGYTVEYNEETITNTQQTQSPLVGLTTGEGIKLETTVEAIVGNDTLKDGDTVKNGEVIKYRVTTKNNGTQNLENVVVKAGVPTGTVVVVPEENFEYTGPSYYTERTDIKEVSETIPSLASGQTHTLEYEVRVNMDTASGTQLSNKANTTYGEFVIDSNELKNTVAEGNIRVTIKRITGMTAKLTPGSPIEYLVIVENLSDNDVNDLKLQIMLENQQITTILDGYYLKLEVSNENQVEIGNVEANGFKVFRLHTQITTDNVNQVEATASITIGNDTYRSNKDIQVVETIGATIHLDSPTAGEYVNIGDEVTYIFTVTNTGTVDKSMIIRDNIPDSLTIKEIYNDDELVMQTMDISNPDTFVNKIGNNLEYNISIEAGQSRTVRIVTEVQKLEEGITTKTITNSGKVLIGDLEKGTSEEITHIIKAEESDMSNIISGVAWLDKNENGQKDAEEATLPNIKVILFDISTNTIAKDKDGNNAETTTNEQGEYSFTRIEVGEYIVLFEYDTTQYELTTYMAEGVQSSQNSKVVQKTVNINGEDKVYAVTDSINLTGNIANINMGLKEMLIYDLELDKYISRIVVQNNKGTKTYDYNDETFAKVEIHRNQINGSVVILEYTIRVKNTGEVAGYVTSIKDYLPSGLEFSSELNSDWYLSGQDLYTNSLKDNRIEPGETRDIKLILTVTINEDNTGLINNRAEIVESYNEYGKLDIDSTENNGIKDEDDFGSVDVIIGPSTGGTIIAYTFLIILNTVLIAVAIYLIFIKTRNRK